MFKTFRNGLTKELRAAKTTFYKQSFATCSQDSNKIWHWLNSLLNRVPNSAAGLRIISDGKEIPEAKLADCFNDYFSNLPECNVNDNACRFFKTNCVHSILLRPTTTSEVNLLFSALNNSNSCDADNIKIKPVKFVIDIIAPVLAHIYNICLSTGVFPYKMQMAKVVALFKKGDKTALSNYRPVSILPIFSKCLEKIIFCRISDFLDKHNLITKHQYAFRKNMSTQLALLEQKELILNNFEERLLTLGVFVDFSKAFDSINHDLLLSKLNHYGIRGIALDLIRSYLGHRQQFVQVNSFKSEVRSVKVGVPQGSILGPLLFNIFINDLVNIDVDTRYVIYADDATLFFSSNRSAELITRANAVLNKLYAWSLDNGLTINSQKTKAVLFRAKNTQITLEEDLLMNNSKIELVNSVKSLGVFFDHTMTWHSHIDFLASKLLQITGIFFP